MIKYFIMSFKWKNLRENMIFKPKVQGFRWNLWFKFLNQTLGYILTKCNGTLANSEEKRETSKETLPKKKERADQAAVRQSGCSSGSDTVTKWSLLLPSLVGRTDKWRATQEQTVAVVKYQLVIEKLWIPMPDTDGHWRLTCREALQLSPWTVKATAQHLPCMLCLCACMCSM